MLANNLSELATLLRIGGDEHAGILPGRFAEAAPILRDEIQDRFWGLALDEKIVLKIHDNSCAGLDRLARPPMATDRTEASLVREALGRLVDRYRDRL